MRSWSFILAAGLLCLLPTIADAQLPCYPPVGDGYVEGYVVEIFAAQPASFASDLYHIKFCKRSQPSVCGGGNTCLSAQGHSDFYIRNPDAYTINPWTTWDFYAWKDDPNDPYGSETVPIDSEFFGPPGFLNLRLAVPPRPFVPTPLSPVQGQTSGGTITASWRDGLNAARRSAQWPARYDIYYKQWAFSDMEPVAWTLGIADYQCATQGTCTATVAGMPQGYYKWYVVAKLDVTAAGYPANTIMQNKSRDDSPAFFKVGSVPATVVYEGCYMDQSAPRALPNRLYPSGGVTVAGCTAAARQAGYKFAGLQYGNQCWAGNAPAYYRRAESECNMACSANTAEKCGGRYRNSIWATGLAW